MTSISTPILIGIDWGTSSLRAFLIGSDGEVLDRISKPQGILHVENGEFEKAFDDLVKAWSPNGNLPVIASGMITSRNGWLETPYIDTPVGATELAAALVPLQTASGHIVNFVTGATTDHDGAPDVMRGEETQIIGACSLGAENGVFVMPGTHSKWITVENNRIQDFSTCMTGEVFGALKKHTILGAFMIDGPFNEAGFSMGVTAGLASGSGLLYDLFNVRTLPLFGKITPDMVEDYLSGMLIGAEIGAADTAANAELITIVGRDDLTDRYEMALTIAGHQSQRAQDDIAARGHFVVAKKAGLIS
tara:strand:- start:276 stop:1190 length:915 start_codon:yes stop_codon:yes gene_type:complete